ncbi:phosphotransferase family protein [Paenibacillus tarimensis]
MEGVNKVRINQKDLNRIIRNAFDCDVKTGTELTDGWANAAYSLELSDGRSVVLKVAPPKGVKLMRYERNMMKTEVEIMKHFGASGDVPVPRIHFYDESESILPVPYFIMEKLHGYPYNKASDTMTPEQREKVERRLGELNRRINDVKGSRFGLYAFESPHDGSWREAFRWLIGGVLEDGREAGVVLPAQYEEFEREIDQRLPALDGVSEPSLVHWDLWAGNVFVLGGEITGLIDFERALWGDPLIEHYFSHFGNSTSFEQGYGISTMEEDARIRRCLYDLYLDLILAIECSFRQYEDRNHVEWAARNLAEGWERFRSV